MRNIVHSLIALLATCLLYAAYIILSPLLTASVKIELPNSTEDISNKDKTVITVELSEINYSVSVGKKGARFVTKNKKDFSMQIKKILSDNPEALVVLSVDKNLSYKRVVQCMALVKELGAKSISLDFSQ